MNQFVTVKTFFYRHEAELAQGLLQEARIPSMISADDCGGFRPDLTLGMNNVRLIVPVACLAEARDRLKVLEDREE